MQAYKSPTQFVKKNPLHRLSLQRSHRKTPLQQHFDSKYSCNLNWFDTSVGICGAEQLPVSAAASYSMQVFERTHVLLTQCY